MGARARAPARLSRFWPVSDEIIDDQHAAPSPPARATIAGANVLEHPEIALAGVAVARDAHRLGSA